jgi:hypothetical protein
MPTVGRIDLKADKDVKAGSEISLSELFPYPERSREFVLESDVEKGRTRIRVNVERIGVIETVADVNRRRGERTSIFMIMKMADFLRRVKAREDIRRGDMISITLET